MHPPILILKEFASLFSALGSLLVIVTFRISSKWQGEFKDTKIMLFFLSFYNLIASIAFCFNPPGDFSNVTCRAQAMLIQFFGIGATFYDAFLSYETKLLVDAAFAEMPVMDKPQRLKPMHIAFHALVVAYGVGVVLWMNLSRDIGEASITDSSEIAVCWIRDPYRLLFLSLIPVWCNMVVIAYCNIRILATFYWAANHMGGGLVVRLTSKTKWMLARLIAIPVVFVILWLPSSIYRVNRVNKTDFSGGGENALAYLWAATFPSAGIFNALIYVAADPDATNAWRRFARRLCCRHSAEDDDSSFKGPTSVYNSDPIESSSGVRSSRPTLSTVVRESGFTESVRESELTQTTRMQSVVSDADEIVIKNPIRKASTSPTKRQW